MKKIIISIVALGSIAFNFKHELSKEIEIISIKMELKAINQLSKDLENQNRAFKNVPSSKFEQLKKDKQMYTKKLKELSL